MASAPPTRIASARPEARYVSAHRIASSAPQLPLHTVALSARRSSQMLTYPSAALITVLGNLLGLRYRGFSSTATRFSSIIASRLPYAVEPHTPARGPEYATYSPAFLIPASSIARREATRKSLVSRSRLRRPLSPRMGAG